MHSLPHALLSALGAIKRFADRHSRHFAILIATISVAGAALYLTPTALALVAPPLDPDLNLSTTSGTAAFTFLDKDGNVIGRRGPVTGEHLGLENMPAYLPAAFIAMEDRRFYSHNGMDLIGLSRAAYADLRAQRFVAGGSTISQQTAKILRDHRERTLTRKAGELLNAVSLENALSKKQILELYLNRIYLGDGAYGIDTAARTYFGVSARRVTLSQAAMLAALTRAPTIFSPRRDLAAAQSRARRVLAAMVETGAITAAQAADAEAHPAAIVERKRDSHSYVLDAAAEQVQKLLGERNDLSGDFVVHTSLDSALQQASQSAAADTIQKYGRKLNFAQTAIVVLKPDGAITAIVGGADYKTSVFDRATQAHRQPGSAFKPFVYLAALEAGISPWDWRDDKPVDISGYQPTNYDNASYGRLRLTDALAHSVNTITVNLAQEVGVANVAAAARRAGIRSPLQDNASLALGTNEVTPLELTAAYCIFANDGSAVTPYLITRIEAAGTGDVLYQHDSNPAPSAIFPSVRRDMVAMLYNVVMTGTGTGARLGAREAAGKTGTTQDYRDGWFVGFTTDYVTGVWVGNDDNTPMRNVTGGSVPARLWNSVMTIAEHGEALRPLDRSQGAPPDSQDSQSQLNIIDQDALDSREQGGDPQAIPEMVSERARAQANLPSADAGSQVAQESSPSHDVPPQTYAAFERSEFRGAPSAEGNRSSDNSGFSPVPMSH